MVQSQFVPRRLKGDCLLDIRQNRLPGAQRIQEWDFDILKQAGSEVAIGGDAQTVALLAKMVTQWRNKTNSPLPPERTNSCAGPSFSLLGSALNPRGSSAVLISGMER